MILYILFNLFLLVTGLFLIYSGFVNFQLFLTLPVGLEILIILGFITPLLNLYDTINNFINLITLLFGKNDEDRL